MKLFLVGFMGVGKTYWGRVWSNITAMPFYDLDKMVEESLHQSIDECFQKKGELGFRKIESDVLRLTSNIKNGIIACGGGAPCYHNNMEWMNENGQTIYIKASTFFLKNQLLMDPMPRPLIQHISEDELLPYIEKKLKERSCFYEKSAIHLLAEQLKPETIKEIIEQI